MEQAVELDQLRRRLDGALREVKREREAAGEARETLRAERRKYRERVHDLVRQPACCV